MFFVGKVLVEPLTPPAMYTPALILNFFMGLDFGVGAETILK